MEDEIISYGIVAGPVRSQLWHQVARLAAAGEVSIARVTSSRPRARELSRAPSDALERAISCSLSSSGCFSRTETIQFVRRLQQDVDQLTRSRRCAPLGLAKQVLVTMPRRVHARPSLGPTRRTSTPVWVPPRRRSRDADLGSRRPAVFSPEHARYWRETRDGAWHGFISWVGLALLLKFLCTIIDGSMRRSRTLVAAGVDAASQLLIAADCWRCRLLSQPGLITLAFCSRRASPRRRRTSSSMRAHEAAARRRTRPPVVRVSLGYRFAILMTERFILSSPITSMADRLRGMPR